MTNYVDAKQLAKMTPYTERRIRALAAEGKIPGAYQFSPGSKWMFDQAEFKRWIKAKEVKPCRFTSVANTGGLESTGMVERSDGPARQVIAEMRKRLKENSANV